MQSDFAVQALNSEPVAALRSRVTVTEDTGMTAAFPNHYRARLRVVFAGGTSIDHQQNDAWGDPELPLSRDGLIAKFAELSAAAGVQADLTTALVDATLSLASSSHVHQWTARWPTLGTAQ
jgi:2-methylcitrate dehydratase PrpD